MFSAHKSLVIVTMNSLAIINGKSNIIIGCIYRHPTANVSEFTPELENLIKQLNQKNYQVYIMGDMNIDFLKYSDHAKTEEYLNMLYSNCLLPLITKPTRLMITLPL